MLEAIDQAMKHLLHFYGLADRGVARGPRNDSDAPRDQIMILEFRGGSESVAEKIAECSLGLLLVALRDNLDGIDMAARMS